MQTHQELLDFRTAYLQAVARAWNDTAFKSRLCVDKAALSVLAEPPINYICPWDIHVSIRDTESALTTWHPHLTKGWIGYDDKLIIYLPEPMAKSVREDPKRTAILDKSYHPEAAASADRAVHDDDPRSAE